MGRATKRQPFFIDRPLNDDDDEENEAAEAKPSEVVSIAAALPGQGKQQGKQQQPMPQQQQPMPQAPAAGVQVPAAAAAPAANSAYGGYTGSAYSGSPYTASFGSPAAGQAFGQPSFMSAAPATAPGTGLEAWTDKPGDDEVWSEKQEDFESMVSGMLDFE